ANEFYRFLSHRSRFVLIDEFQDTSLLQFNILKPIIQEVISGTGTKPFGGLIVVGDEKQSIFGWRGGERDLLLNLKDIFSGQQEVKTDSLLHSWRSSPHLMDFINGVFSDEALHRFLNDKDMNWSYPAIQSQRPELNPGSMLHLQVLNHQKQGKNASCVLDDIYKYFVTEMIIPNLVAGEKTVILCRKGKELAEIQAVLDEENEGSIFQPSANLVEHKLVKPLLAWLRYIAYDDWMSFLAWLRSDYVLLKPEYLKVVVDAMAICQNQEEMQEPDFGSVALAQMFFALGKTCKSWSIQRICLQICQLCLSHKELGERDHLNLHAFLSLVKDYELNQSSCANSIPAFLNYLDDNLSQDMLKQKSIESSDTLELQTIHKAKGLQYERVFVLYNLSNRPGSSERKLNTYLDYSTSSFEELRDFAITINYADILKESDYASLAELDQKRQLLEELNTLYVAFTRAKTKLHILFTYENQKNWDDYLQDRSSEKLSLTTLLCDACQNYMKSANIARNEQGWLWKLEPDPNIDQTLPSEKNSQEIAAVPLPEKLPLADWNRHPLDDAIPRTQEAFFDTKEAWLQKRNSLFGTIAHYYLSHLYHNNSTEHEIAETHTIREFGALLPALRIKEYLLFLRQSISKHLQIFDPAYDRIYNEISLWDDGKTYRIDRLMLDTKAKKALILDYKTGGIHDPEQLNLYKKLLEKHPAIQAEGYVVHLEYLEI
ncbi:MAG: 3'-5' exonuclease, partial [Candidatus Cloacimonadaceae bacterium]|nr:3'-5' exonuclease [Candidatus Cloacimonadaceae bacterium]